MEEMEEMDIFVRLSCNEALQRRRVPLGSIGFHRLPKASLGSLGVPWGFLGGAWGFLEVPSGFPWGSLGVPSGARVSLNNWFTSIQLLSYILVK